jgi:uncharacterized membrane protein YhaH (DUF805 family)
VAFALLAIVLAPIAAGASALVACAVTTGATSLALLGAALVVRRDEDRTVTSGLLALVPAVPAVGWAALTRSTSIAVLAVVVASALACDCREERVATRRPLGRRRGERSP